MRTADRCITGRSPFIWLGLNVSCDDATPASGVIEDRHPSQVPVLVFGSHNRSVRQLVARSFVGPLRKIALRHPEKLMLEPSVATHVL